MPRYFDETGREVDPFATDDDEFEEQPPPTTTNPLREQIRRLERQNRDLKAKVDTGEAAARKLAFIEAGVQLTNPDGSPNPMAQYFVDGYKGDVAPDAIKAAAQPLGLVQPPTQQPGQQTPQQPFQQGPQQMQHPGQQPVQPGFQQQGVQDAFQQAQTAYRAMQQVGDSQMPGVRDFDAEMRAAPNQAEANRILTEKHAAMGHTGVPAIVHD